MAGDHGQDPREKARWQALGRLGVREYSAAEMRQYLKRKGHDEAVARDVVEALVAEGSLSEARFAGAIAREQFIRDKGPMKVAQRLRSKGVALPMSEVRKLYSEAASGGSGEADTNGERAAIESILERRYPDAKTDPNEKRKAYQALMRRGFSPELISRCLGMALYRD